MDLKNSNNKEFENDNTMSKVVNFFTVVSINPLITHAKAKKPTEFTYCKKSSENNNNNNMDITTEVTSTKKLIKFYIDYMDVIKYSRYSSINSDYANQNSIEIIPNKEKWIRLSKKSDFWLRIFYTKKYNRQCGHGPITMIKEIECEVLNSEYIVRYFYKFYYFFI